MPLFAFVKDEDVIRVPRVQEVNDVFVDICEDDMVAGLNKEGSNEPATDVSGPEMDSLEIRYGHGTAMPSVSAFRGSVYGLPDKGSTHG